MCFSYVRSRLLRLFLSFLTRSFKESKEHVRSDLKCLKERLKVFKKRLLPLSGLCAFKCLGSFFGRNNIRKFKELIICDSAELL